MLHALLAWVPRAVGQPHRSWAMGRGVFACFSLAVLLTAGSALGAEPDSDPAVWVGPTYSVEDGMAALQELAQRHAWPGVEHQFAQLEAATLGALDADVWALAAESARVLGITAEWHRRLTRLYALQPEPDVREQLDRLERSYGRLEIHGKERWELVLACDPLPAEPEQRKSAEYAIMSAMESGSFVGMVPAGTWTLGQEDALVLEVEPGADPVVIDAERSHRAENNAHCHYCGPVVFAGYSTRTSDGAPGFSVRGGASTPFVRDMHVGYQASVHAWWGDVPSQQVDLGVFGAWRPGRARMVAGPNLGVRFGDSGAVFSWGLSASAGYGLARSYHRTWLAEIGADAWHGDGGWVGAVSVRIGFVPRVLRFDRDW